MERKKLAALGQSFSDLEIVTTSGTTDDLLIQSYVEIDSFSQGLNDKFNSDFSARNMGKNDLWIAATAHSLGAKLLTTDKDFVHLDGIFIDVVLIEV